MEKFQEKIVKVSQKAGPFNYIQRNLRFEELQRRPLAIV